MFILRCETVCWLVCGFYEISEKVYYHGIWRAVWGDLRVRERRMDMLEDAVSYRVENQAGERVGVENRPGSDYNGRQCRLLKGIAKDVKEIGGCGLELRKSSLYLKYYMGCHRN